MKPNRLEAFSDGVFAIIITIMVLEFRPTAENAPSALIAMAPNVGAYLLSFVIVGVHWLSHHRLIDQVETVTPGFLWANLALLFWLSLVPFATANMGHHHWSGFSIVMYMAIIVCCSLALFMMRVMAPAIAKAGAARAAQAATVRLSAIIVALQAGTTALAYFFPKAALLLMAGFAVLGISMTFRGTEMFLRAPPAGRDHPATP